MGQKIRNSKFEIRKGGWRFALFWKPDIHPMRAPRAKNFEFDRFEGNEDGRSISLRSVLISNFEFFISII